MLIDHIALLQSILLISIYFGLFTAMVIGILNSNGWRNHFLEKAPNKWVYKAIDCTLCFAFWLMVPNCIVGYVIEPNEDWLIVPFIASPIARYFA